MLGCCCWMPSLVLVVSTVGFPDYCSTHWLCSCFTTVVWCCPLDMSTRPSVPLCWISGDGRVVFLILKSGFPSTQQLMLIYTGRFAELNLIFSLWEHPLRLTAHSHLLTFSVSLSHVTIATHCFMLTCVLLSSASSWKSVRDHVMLSEKSVNILCVRYHCC